MACVFLCDTEHGLGQHYFPDDNLQQMVSVHRFYGERNYKDLGYLQEVKHICTDDEKSERKKAEAMKSHIVFGKATDKDRAKAQQLWEQNGKASELGLALGFQKWF